MLKIVTQMIVRDGKHTEMSRISYLREPTGHAQVLLQCDNNILLRLAYRYTR